ncbi:meiotic recombination protein REC8 homolog [Myripristis murdjan]|uniref:meiotic recombination protein REC8 homolog n=1 Tax=Myripristis murdjan TaxID=586833 RepID=UPI0011764899|nr:meiotic recombination protein REC8 homolog [Myripristis murdjan]
MFYYPEVLRRHTGCFSTIWLVATKGIKVPRRDFLKVNVTSTCVNIMNYVLQLIPAPRPGLPQPRFSLYLSSQLQYGVIVVYHRQCAILLEDLQTVVGRLVKHKISEKIDIDDQTRQALLFPDALALLEETEGAPDPLFGVMHFQEALPSPNTLIQMGQERMRGASPEQPQPTSRASPAEDSMMAPTDSITLRDRDPASIPASEFDWVEFGDHSPDTVDLLLAQADHFPEGDMELRTEGVTEGEEESEMEREREGRVADMEGVQTKELTRSTIELQPTVSSEDAMVLVQEEPGLPMERPAPPAEEQTPPPLPMPPSPSGEERRPRQKRPSPEMRRRRQLTFFDPETQLSQEVLQQQINNPLTETKSPLFPLSPSRRLLPAADLLNNPCIFLPEALQLLWRPAAVITPLSGLDLQVGERGPDSTDSDREREQERASMAQREQETQELSSEEVPREMAESELFLPEISGPDILSLEVSDQKELSREISPLGTPESRESPVSRSVSRLQDIPEEVEAVLGTAEDESPERGPDADVSGIMPDLAEFAEHHVAPVLFHSLLPPGVDRRTVSNSFWRLLESVSTRRLHVEQDEPYGDIRISPGPSYEEGDL